MDTCRSLTAFSLVRDDRTHKYRATDNSPTVGNATCRATIVMFAAGQRLSLTAPPRFERTREVVGLQDLHLFTPVNAARACPHDNQDKSLGRYPAIHEEFGGHRRGL